MHICVLHGTERITHRTRCILRSPLQAGAIFLRLSQIVEIMTLAFQPRFPQPNGNLQQDFRARKVVEAFNDVVFRPFYTSPRGRMV